MCEDRRRLQPPIRIAAIRAAAVVACASRAVQSNLTALRPPPSCGFGGARERHSTVASYLAAVLRAVDTCMHRTARERAVQPCTGGVPGLRFG